MKTRIIGIKYIVSKLFFLIYYIYPKTYKYILTKYIYIYKMFNKISKYMIVLSF